MVGDTQDARRGDPLPPVVLAFGGNALLPDPFHPEEQEARAAALARVLTLLLPSDSGAVLVHGNGPQVGMILLRVEATRDQLPQETLDVLVAETQGSVGFLLARVLRNALRDQASKFKVATILTQVVVDPADPRFGTPSKPIGPFYPAERAELLRTQRDWDMIAVEGKGWRRVVPSPLPREIVEIEAIRDAAQPGHVVIAGGGGGVPVVRDAAGHLDGVEAVLDKDRTAALMAISLAARGFVLLTGVPCVQRAFGTPRAERIDRVNVAGVRELLAAGEFPPGSMGPKMEAAADYAEHAGREALITSVEALPAALRGDEGTRVVP